MSSLRLIGDVHCKIPKYLELIKDVSQSIQIGDMGVGFSWGHTLPTEQAENHKFIRGNHDNPEVCRAHPAYLGEFGTITIADDPVFFMGGAWSIDWSLRTSGVSWWPDEQLDDAQLEEAYQLYIKTKPKLVITHDAPTEMAREMVERFSPFGSSYSPQRTNTALQRMFEAYQPAMWVFGHHHSNYHTHRKNTLFVCLGELQVLDLDMVDAGNITSVDSDKESGTLSST